MSLEKFAAVFKQETGLLFVNKVLLSSALTHDSCGKAGSEFERMEFLGDACLELTVAALLFKNTGLPEGKMSQIRSKLTCKESLANILRAWKVEDSMQLGSGMDKKDLPDSVYADFFESILGALYLDQGHDVLFKCVEVIFTPMIRDILESPDSVNNHKSRLQEHVMSMGQDLPVYTITNKIGPSHHPTYVIQVLLPGGKQFEGRAHTIKGAEQAAAKNALEDLGIGSK